MAIPRKLTASRYDWRGPGGAVVAKGIALRSPEGFRAFVAFEDVLELTDSMVDLLEEHEAGAECLTSSD